MAVNTKFNVKVPLNVSGSETPGQDMAVYWDEGSGSFELTASLGGGGGNQNLQSVTNFGKSSSLGGLFLWGQNLDWGNQTGINASSGFRTSSIGNNAYSHVTPQLRKTEQLILTIPARRVGDEYAPFPYPDNYITYGGVRLGSIGDGDGDADDVKEVCNPKFDNITQGISFSFSSVVSGDTIQTNYVLIAELLPAVGMIFTLSGFDDPNYQVTLTCTSVVVGGAVQFTAGTPTIPSGITQEQRGFCLSYSSRKSNRLIVEGQSFDAGGGNNKSGTALIELRGNSGSGQDAGQDGGMLLSSAGNIYFFNATTGSVSGSLIPISASAQISLKSDNSLHFSTKDPLSNPTSESFKDILVISSSGTEPRISVGFNPNEIPEKPFEIKTDKDDATGTEFVLEGSRKSTPYEVGDELGKISFIAASASFSGSERFTKGEGATIRSLVGNQSKDGIRGELRFGISTDNNLAPEEITRIGQNIVSTGGNMNVNLGNHFLHSGSAILQDHVSESFRYRAGLFIADSSGSQNFRVTNLDYGNQYNSELVLTGSAKISGSANFDASIHMSSSRDIYLSRDSQIYFRGANSHTYGQLGIVKSGSGIDDDDRGQDAMYISAGGNATLRLYNVSGAVFFEQSSINPSLARDFRIEGASTKELFFVSGGADRIGIGTRTPSEKLTVEGNISASGDITSNTFETISTTLASDSATNVDTFNSSSYNGAIYDYILKDTGVGARAGQFMVAHDDGSVTFTDTSTKHLTDSTIPDITADIDGANIRVRVTNGNGYTFKAFAKKL